MNRNAAVLAYCARIGADPLLVQGAGGNVSWKACDTLWIKASGTWLADAARRDIFVAVDLAQLQAQLTLGNFDLAPRLAQPSSLRPSIETLLHALMPQAVVVHVHAIEVLAHLVRRDADADLASALRGVPWTQVAYQKPGPELARAVQAALQVVPDAKVVLLKNHGVVIGGADTIEVDDILRGLIARLAVTPRSPVNVAPPEAPLTFNGADVYLPLADSLVHQLATDPVLYERLSSSWALYPDHLVFLGAQAHAFASIAALQTALQHCEQWPELVFVRGLGVFAQASFDHVKLAQLRCYHDVISRQTNEVLNRLEQNQIDELLNWDAEHYRMEQAKRP